MCKVVTIVMEELEGAERAQVWSCGIGRVQRRVKTMKVVMVCG